MKFIYRELFLPTQYFFNKFFIGNKKEFIKKLYETINNILRLKNPKKEFKLNLSKLHSIEEMASPPLALNFYKFLCNIIKPNKILEIGTFIGISALTFAKSSGKKTKITTIEKFSEFFTIADNNFRLNKLSHKIKNYQGDALQVLLDIKKQKYDLIFLDGDKGKYLELFKIIEKKFIKKNSIIIIDNFFFHGDTLNNECKTSKGLGVKRLHTYIKKSKNYIKTIIPIYDGITLLMKK